MTPTAPVIPLTGTGVVLFAVRPVPELSELALPPALDRAVPEERAGVSPPGADVDGAG